MIFEAIDIVGRPPPPPMIVMQGKYIMADCFPSKLHPNALILTSEIGFTNN
jgi:hypothetical protein